MNKTNPFARAVAATPLGTLLDGLANRPERKLSGFERLPADYRAICETLGKQFKRSPQNRQVRAIADRLYVGSGTRK
jgi:hypothetical protein